MLPLSVSSTLRTIKNVLNNSPSWWLLDDERVILMWFTEDGEIREKIVISDPDIVARHCEWRDLAVGNAIPAEEIAA